MTFRLGLTGSIGMGKSTTAKMFAEAGCAVWDADAAVHRLYQAGGAAVVPIGKAFPEAIIDGAVSRAVLKKIIGNAPDALAEIERIVHPLVAEDRAAFAQGADSDIIVFDIPLLFETRGDADMDAVVCVMVDPQTQERRVLSRGTMTKEQFRQIKDKQLADAEKRARSDYVIETTTLEGARRQVADIVAEIRRKVQNA